MYSYLGKARTLKDNLRLARSHIGRVGHVGYMDALDTSGTRCWPHIGHVSYTSDMSATHWKCWIHWLLGLFTGVGNNMVFGSCV
jgi:hypothetical protein